jgi:hypothetical protein
VGCSLSPKLLIRVVLFEEKPLAFQPYARGFDATSCVVGKPSLGIISG